MAKTKVAVTLDSQTLRRVDRLVRDAAIRTGAKPLRRQWRLNWSGSNIGVWTTSVPSSIQQPSG